MRFSALLVGALAACGLAAPAPKLVWTTIYVTAPEPHFTVVTSPDHYPFGAAPSTITEAPFTIGHSYSSVPLPSETVTFVTTIGAGTWSPSSTSVDVSSTHISTSTSTFGYPTRVVSLERASSATDGLFAETSFAAVQPSNVAHAPAGSPSPEDDCERSHPHDVSFCRNVIVAHNRHRRNHSSVDIWWDEDLHKSALQVANGCNFSHVMDAMGGGYGQNLLVGGDKEQMQSAITNSWYNSEFNFFQKENYGRTIPLDMEDPKNQTWEKYSHFTQIIWNSSSHVGCAVSNYCKVLGCQPKFNPETGKMDCPDGIMENYGNLLTVCNYKDQGNYKPLYDKNIFAPRNDATYTAPNKDPEL